MANDVERQVIELIAADRLDIPISSMSGKLKRMKPKLAGAIDLDPSNGSFQGQRVYARIEAEDKLKARGMQDGIERFEQEFPEQGEVLRRYIEEERSVRETHFYFGVNEGCRLTADDYLAVMTKMGFTESQARNLYEPIIEAGRRISRKREEAERSVLIG